MQSREGAERPRIGHHAKKYHENFGTFGCFKKSIKVYFSPAWNGTLDISLSEAVYF